MVVLGAEDATRDDTSDGATKADAEDTHAAAITADFIFGTGLRGEMERVTGLCERSLPVDQRGWRESGRSNQRQLRAPRNYRRQLAWPIAEERYA